ncbi:MAG: DUF2628 domain-containing protein [Rhodospirillales bacterium]|nr:DUF2628 domain-containing protein [Rhodospirillales bacterium]
MRLYSVFLRRPGPDADLQLVKQGFSWPAFFFSVLWALWGRLWWVAAGLVAANIASSAVIIGLGVGPIGQAAVSFGLALAVGYLGNDLKGWTLDRRGFAESGVVSGRNRDEALRRYLDERPELAETMTLEPV